jgi:S-adenosylmethionine decarboxylase
MHKLAPQEVATERAVLTHVMLDMYGVNSKTLDDPNQIGQALTGAAAAANMHPLAEPAVYRYPGQGLTVFLPIRESHFAIHTYPEHGYASVDIVSCALAERAQRAADFVVGCLSPDRVDNRLVSRGHLENLWVGELSSTD